VIRRSGVGGFSGDAEEAESSLSDGFGLSQEKRPLLGEGDAFSLLPSVDMVGTSSRKGGRDGWSQAWRRTAKYFNVHGNSLPLYFLHTSLCLRVPGRSVPWVNVPAYYGMHICPWPGANLEPWHRTSFTGVRHGPHGLHRRVIAAEPATRGNELQYGGLLYASKSKNRGACCSIVPDNIGHRASADAAEPVALTRRPILLSC
jgi:hypothetical protein